jgi:hypothetical protein
MSLATLDNILLREKVDPVLTAKGSELTFDEEDTNFVIIHDAIKELAVIEVGGVDAYDAGEEYSLTSPATYVTYGNNTWQYINAVPSTGVTPGTDPTTWALASSGAFSHSQNTDTKLAEGTVNEVTALEIRTFLDSDRRLTLNEQVDSYTAVLSDALNKLVELNKATALNFTVPPNASVAFAIGDVMTIYQKGIGQVTILPGSGVTINAAVDLSPYVIKLRAQYSSAALIKTATNTWLCVGDLES